MFSFKSSAVATGLWEASLTLLGTVSEARGRQSGADHPSQPPQSPSAKHVQERHTLKAGLPPSERRELRKTIRVPSCWPIVRPGAGFPVSRSPACLLSDDATVRMTGFLISDKSQRWARLDGVVPNPTARLESSVDTPPLDPLLQLRGPLQ